MNCKQLLWMANWYYFCITEANVSEMGGWRKAVVNLVFSLAWGKQSPLCSGKLSICFNPGPSSLPKRYSDVWFVWINILLTSITHMSYVSSVPHTQVAQFQSHILLNCMLSSFLLQAELKKWFLIEQGKHWEEISEYLALRRKAMWLEKSPQWYAFNKKKAQNWWGKGCKG